MSEKQTLKELLDEIINKKGPYSQDQLTHAENVMEKASNNAMKIKEILIKAFTDIRREAENAEWSDAASGARHWLRNLGVDIPEGDY